MNIVAASFLAILSGWAVTVAGAAAVGFITINSREHAIVSAMITGVHAAALWLFFLLLLSWKRTHPLLHRAKWSWLSWGLLALACDWPLLLLHFGFWAIALPWYPAAVGVIGGSVFALLRRKTST